MRKSDFRLLCTGILLSAQALCAAAEPAAPQPVPYDGDLFNKDKSVCFVTPEFLYWKVNEGSLDYAVKMNQPAWSTTQSTYAMGHYENARFDWNPGFRLGVGFFNAPHFWDALFQYTYLPTGGSNRSYAPGSSGQFLNGTWTQPDVGTGSPPAPLIKATSRIDLRYHVFEYLFSRRFHPNEHFRMNLFGGITSAFIYQKWKIAYEDINNQMASIRNRWQFEGVGLRLGVKLDWFMRCDFYLTGQVSSAILSGWYKNMTRERTSATIANANNSIPIRDTDFHDNRLTYMTQFLLGPSWQKSFEKVRTELLAGYELTIWTNLHEIHRSSFAAPTAAKETFINSSNLSLQGLTVRFNIDF